MAIMLVGHKPPRRGHGNGQGVQSREGGRGARHPGKIQGCTTSSNGPFDEVELSEAMGFQSVKY